VSQPKDTATEFLLRSDEALYQSKREGRNQVTVYRESDEDLEMAAAAYIPGS